MTSTLSKFYIYTTYPRQEFEQDVSNEINILDSISQNSYDNIMIIIGGAYWNYNPKYDTICKNIRMSLENYVDKKNLIINIDGDKDRFTPKNNEKNTYIHLKLFLSHETNCPFIIELFKFIDNYLSSGCKICIINSVFEYGSIIGSKTEVSEIFNKYKNRDNIKILNVVNFPSTELNTRYDISLIITNLVSNYKNEFIFWKKIYEIINGKDYKEDIKCNNIKLITFDTFLMYYIDLFFNELC
tara:strand:+ start:2463 stop:3188 length:726 start_codon:yes stop_codon:yes gene_type:complete